MKTEVLICSDFLMTSENEQFSNRRWLLDLLKRPILLATGINPTSFFSSLSQPQAPNRSTFFSLSGISLDTAATQFWYDDSLIIESSLQYLRRFLERARLVIGYELSEQTRRILTLLDVPYIDIWLHPIRYLDDILFAFNSNVSDIREKLAHYDLPDEYYYMYATRLAIQRYKGYRRAELELKAATSVFVGQTLNDKSVIVNGKPTTLLDFKSRFENLVADSSEVYYCRHPYVRNGDEEVLGYLAQFPTVRLSNVPAYSLIAHPNVDNVATISSSVGLEARYFGKNVQIYHKPIIKLSGADGYVSIYQDLVNPHFWSTILTPLIPTKQVPNIRYLDGRDKLRDMLAFYWSYKHIDKLESLRSDITGIRHEISALKKSATRETPSAITESSKRSSVLANELKITLPDARQIERQFRQIIKPAKVVSFDIFDTLVHRLLYRTDEVYALIPIFFPDLFKQLNCSVDDFISARRNARTLCIKSGHRGEEVPLLARYEATVQQLSAPANLKFDLVDAEQNLDKRLIQERTIGTRLLGIARESGKRIILVSDTFYTKSYIAELLQSVGIGDYAALYVSSDLNLTKHSGNLFTAVLEKENVRNFEIVHVGDNTESDGTKARQHGITSFLLASRKEYSIAAKVSYDNNYGNLLFNTIGKGLAEARLHYPTPLVGSTHTGGSPARLGYSLFGPLLAGFALWILRRAEAKQVKQLLFLARDGHIAFRACNAFKHIFTNSPKLTYFYASRRGVAFPSCHTLSDLNGLLSQPYSPSPLHTILESRFSITADELSTELLRRHGFNDRTDIVRYDVDNSRVALILNELAPKILARAATERQLYTEYFDRATSGSSNDLAVVDIGHQGNIQKWLTSLLRVSPIGGFYFVTQAEIQNNIVDPNWSEGYLASELDSKSDHFYNRLILLFEFLFLNNEGSFIRMSSKNNELIPIQRELGNEAQRAAFIQKVHDSAVRYCKDLARLCGSHLSNIETDATGLATPLVSLFDSPSYSDAEMFRDLVFENFYSGRPPRPVVSEKSDALKKGPGSAIWKAGCEALSLNRG